MVSKKYQIAFAADPIEKFNSVNETTFFIMEEICRRGWGCHTFDLKNLYLQHEKPFAIAKKVHVTRNKDQKFAYEILKEQALDLAKVDAVMLRKDPPVDIHFMDHLTILELLQGKTLLINDPSSIKFAAEKIFPLYFSEFVPESLVSQNKTLIKNFVAKHKTAVLKPLNQAGGRGVVKVQANDPSLASLMEILTQNETNFVIAQKYIPKALKGDKRILILDGNILGAFLRVPPKNDFRGNLHSGATLKKCGITKTDQKIVDTIAPVLKKMHLHFVGIDILDTYLTEINVTSPMGIREINVLNGEKIEKEIVDWLERTILNPF